MEIGFRINSVNPDIDDRLLEPSMARIAYNLRLGASTDDTDLGATLFNNLQEIPYDLPQGENEVTGIDNDFETQTIYYSLWNSEGNHGIYQLKNSAVSLVISGSWLNFQREGEVSITSIDGKLYWTDNFNPPRMLNIAKAIAGEYPSSPREWMFTQIKRPGAFPPIVLREASQGNYVAPLFTRGFASEDIDNGFQDDFAYQFSYFYVYDNFEESRLAPASVVSWYTSNLKVGVPPLEFDSYLLDLNIIQSVVFVYRRGNEGVWYEFSRVDNASQNYSQPTGSPVSIWVDIPKTSLLSKNAVPTSITNADFDSVPRLSKCNVIAVNRIMHSNYLLDYPNWDGLSLSVRAVKATPDDLSTQSVFKPGAIVNVGVELLDLYGRKIGVINQTQVEIPDYEKWNYFTGFQPTPEPQWRSFFALGNPYWNRDLSSNCYRLEYTLTGNLPEWCHSYRIVYSPSVNIIDSQRTNAKMWYWYSKEGADYLSGDGGLINKDGYVRLGFAVELSSGEPFLVENETNSYVNIIGLLGVSGEAGGETGPQFTAIPSGWQRKYRIEKQVNGLLYFKVTDISKITPLPILFTQNPNVTIYGEMSWWDIELTKEAEGQDPFYYSNTEFSLNPGDALNSAGILEGDYFLNQFAKPNFGGEIGVVFYNLGATFSPATVVTNGVAISRSPVNLYSQVWDKSIGQPNVVNENQRETRFADWIIPSDPIILGSEINGLSKFNSVDAKQMPAENGPITAIVPTNAAQAQPGVMLAIGTLGIQSVYLQALQQTGNDGQQVVSLSTNVLGTTRPLVGQFGASQLRSVSVTPNGTVYWWSEIVNDWIRYQSDGLNRLGLDEGRPKYSFSNLIRNSYQGGDFNITVFDQLTGEAIIIAKGRDAFVYSERYKLFNGLREISLETPDGKITPERAASLAINHYYFLQGRVWESDPGSPGNSVFGQRKNPQIEIVAVDNFQVQKRWGGIEMFGPRPVSADITAENAQQTNLQAGEWVSRKDSWQAGIKCDENSTGGKMNGRPMESRILKLNFTYQPQGFDKLNLIVVSFVPAIVQ